MENARFDAFARAMAEGGTRRGLLRGAGAGALAWLGLTRSTLHTASQEPSASELTFPIAPVCTCPEGLVLCQGLCVTQQDCEHEQVIAVGSNVAEEGVAGREAVATTPEADSACPPQEKFCPAKGICVSCPTQMILDGDCTCICRTKNATRCDATCKCPKVASCSCGCPGPPCNSPKLQNAKTCECICPKHRPCTGGKMWDEKTCSCLCPADQQLCGGECVACPPGAKLNRDTCACGCSFATCGEKCCNEGQVCDTRGGPPACCTPHNTCPLPGHCGSVSDNCGGVLDLGPCPDEACHTGICQPGDLCNACVYEEVRNGEQGPLCTAAGESCCGGVCCQAGQSCQNGVCCASNEICPCRRTCPPGLPLDPATCTCGCPKGMQRCQGKCVECPEGCCPDSGSCGCVCLDCLENFVLDPDICACICPQTACPPNWSLDKASCTCVCGPTPCAPGSNWLFDQASCSCVCVPPVSCAPNFVFNEESCSCVCPMTECSPNHVWDLEACTCTCAPQECPANHVFDESLCGCVCEQGGCPPNFVFDETNCACLCAAECPPTFVFDEATCSCLCELEACPPNLTFDPGNCACYCAEVPCSEGKVFDSASCSCVG